MQTKRLAARFDFNMLPQDQKAGERYAAKFIDDMASPERDMAVVMASAAFPARVSAAFPARVSAAFPARVSAALPARVSAALPARR